MTESQVSYLKAAYQYARAAAKMPSEVALEAPVFQEEVKTKFGGVTEKRCIRHAIEMSASFLKAAGIKVGKLPGHLGAHDAIAIRANALRVFISEEAEKRGVSLTLAGGKIEIPCPAAPAVEVVCKTTSAVAPEEKMEARALDKGKAQEWVEALEFIQDGTPELKKALDVAKMYV